MGKVRLFHLVSKSHVNELLIDMLLCSSDLHDKVDSQHVVHH